MLAPRTVEYLPCRLRASGLHVGQPLLEALDSLHAIEKRLVGSCILNDDLGLERRPSQAAG